jgi:hypothetical protein
MLKFVIWGIGLLTVVAAVDRVLLWLESLGWINYSRNKLSRGGAMYHTLELHSVFDPGMQEDESGAPPCQERGGELADGEAVKARPPES